MASFVKKIVSTATALEFLFRWLNRLNCSLKVPINTGPSMQVSTVLLNLSHKM